MTNTKQMRTLLGLMSLGFILVLPNISLHELLYISTFALGGFIFRKNRSWANTALIVIFVSFIFQLNDFNVSGSTDIAFWYRPINIAANVIHGVLFLIIAGTWIPSLNRNTVKHIIFDDLGIAVLVSSGILMFYFCLRFVFIEFHPRELLFVWQMIDASVMFFILRDYLFMTINESTEGKL